MNIKKQRTKMFPNIKDWSADHYCMRYAGLDKLSVSEWVWFSPFAYKLFKYIPWLWVLIGIIIASVFISSYFYIFVVFPIILLFKTFVELKKCSDLNLYDLYLRDYSIKNAKR